MKKSFSFLIFSGLLILSAAIFSAPMSSADTAPFSPSKAQNLSDSDADSDVYSYSGSNPNPNPNPNPNRNPNANANASSNPNPDSDAASSPSSTPASSSSSDSDPNSSLDTINTMNSSENEIIGHAVDVFTKNRDIFVRTKDGRTIQITHKKMDADPILSPNRKLIAFIRETEQKYPSTFEAHDNLGTEFEQESNLSQIWLYDIEKQTEKLLVDYKIGEKLKPEEQLVEFDELQISSDGKYLYFLTEAWAISNALHRYRFDTNTVEYFTDAISYFLFDANACENAAERDSVKQFQDYVIALQHRYYALFGGSYEQWNIFSPDKKYIGPTDLHVIPCFHKMR